MPDIEPSFPKRFESKPEIEIDARLLFDRLAKLEKNATVDYEELNNIIGRDVRTVAKTAFERARSRLCREKQMLFAAEQGVRVRRLDDDGLIEQGPKRRKRVYKQVKLGLMALQCVDFNPLTNEKKIKHNAEYAALGTIALFSGNKEQKRIEKVSTPEQPMPIGKVLEIFKV